MKFHIFKRMEAELKKQNIRDWLEKTDNFDLLTQIEAVIASETDEDRWNSLTKEEQDGIDEALESLRRGEGIPGEVVWSEINQRFGAREVQPENRQE